MSPLLDIHIIVFAKAPLPGLAKTRLIPALGEQGSAQLANTMLQHTLIEAAEAGIGSVELCAAPASNHPAWKNISLPAGIDISDQGEGDLGQRMERATLRALRKHQAVLLIGSDCPSLTATTLINAAKSLETHQACIIPASDGGYVLLGLRKNLSTLFTDIPWSTAGVAQLTQQRIREAGWHCEVLPTLHDIDEPADLQWAPHEWLSAK